MIQGRFEVKVISSSKCTENATETLFSLLPMIDHKNSQQNSRTKETGLLSAI